MPLDTSTPTVNSTVTAASAQFTGTLLEGQEYTVSSSTACWILVAANPTAVAGAAGNIFVPANYPFVIFARQPSMKVAIIRDAADGKASLSLGNPE